MSFIGALADKKHEHTPHLSSENSCSTPCKWPHHGRNFSLRLILFRHQKAKRRKSIGNQVLAVVLTELHPSCLALPFHFPYKSKLHISLPYSSLLLGQSGKLASDLWYAPHSAFLRVFLQKIAVIALHIHYLERYLEKDLPGDKEITRFPCSSRTVSCGHFYTYL